MAEGGTENTRLDGSEWNDAIQAVVPGSVHTALVKAGRMPDPKFGRNDSVAHAQSFKTWWYRKTFTLPPTVIHPRLVFNGVAISCTVWLNGKLLGRHNGMFGGPAFELTNVRKGENTLVVRLEPAPGDPSAWNNPDWRKTVVFNCTWGWHYSSIPPMGIWRSVLVEGEPTVKVVKPFVATIDAQKGLLSMVVDLKGAAKHWSGNLTATFNSASSSSEEYGFTATVSSNSYAKRVQYRFTMPHRQLWWPNGLGKANLYNAVVSFKPSVLSVCDVVNTSFGIRSIKMAPLPGGERSDRYNWTFVVNGKPIFVKGCNWCTMDSSMDFSPARYERFIKLAHIQNVQMFRAWGSGMPETNEFYDLCDRYGIMVMQEWPTAWDSHLVQPYGALEETVRLNTLRLRNHPSLVMYGGGNESSNPYGKAIDMMGRYAIELDGTRPFHRGEPLGGSMHNYNCYWGMAPLDHNVNMVAPFFGEFGLACMPDYESVMRYLPDSEKTAWPPPAGGSLEHHTPIFGTADDINRLTTYSRYFTPVSNIKEFITGSQLSQVVGLRHTLEHARTRWPNCTGALYYKMNDNYPAASWSCVDWYGAPKLSDYFFRSVFAPLHACVIFRSLNNVGKPMSLPVYLMDDASILKGNRWKVAVRAYNSNFNLLATSKYPGNGSISTPKQLGLFKLTSEQTTTEPLFIVVETLVNDKRVDQTFYFVNYESKNGCLFKLPRTTLSLTCGKGVARVTNTGKVPAVSVLIQRPGHADTFTAWEGCFWLAPGETRIVKVDSTDGLIAKAWNVD